jgi:glutathione synthase/RimK-type ligase-like ATP-grasp enzyme
LNIALATSDASTEPKREEATLVDALAELGATAEIVDWRSSQEWRRYDVVVVRSTWNYQDHHAAFLRWIDAVASQTRMMNPPGVMKANTVKTYLRVLAEHGVPVVPTQWITPSDLDEIAEIGDVVVKPSVGATGSGLRRFEGSEGVREHVASLLHLGEVMIQPFVRSVAEVGETSAVFIGGRFTHAVHKIAREGEFRVQSEFGGTYSLATPTSHSIEVAERAIDALSGGHDTLAYARVDLVLDEDGSPLVGEVELVEPDLFLSLNPAAARQLAAFITSRTSSGTQAQGGPHLDTSG